MEGQSTFGEQRATTKSESDRLGVLASMKLDLLQLDYPAAPSDPHGYMPENHSFSVETIPSEVAQHPLVHRKFFAVLDTALLEELEKEFGSDHFDPEIWQIERCLATVASQRAVGTRSGQLVCEPILQPECRLSSLLDDQMLNEWGKSREDVTRTLQQLNRHSADFWRFRQAYCGWLLTNPTFVSEHDSLFDRWRKDIAKDGIPLIGAPVPDARQVGARPSTVLPRRSTFVEEFESFYVRWRLDHMTAPYLPVPMSPQFPVTYLPSVLGHMGQGGATFFLPDTCPVPSRDEFRQLLEDAVRGQDPPEHIAEWCAIVSAGNTAKQTIGRFARLFLLKHFWLTLHVRHGDRLDQSVTRLERVMATFLEGGETAQNTIHKDLGILRERLGKNWFLPSTSAGQS